MEEAREVRETREVREVREVREEVVVKEQTPERYYPGVQSMKRVKVSPPKEGQLYPQIDFDSDRCDVTCLLPPITYHLSPPTCHLSPPTYHLSPPTGHLSPPTSHLSPPASPGRSL